MSEDRPQILVIDDERLSRQVLERALLSMGYRVLPARNGQEGLELYREEGPELVLVDLRMPGMDGFEVVEALVEMDPEVSAVVMTGYGSIEAAVRAMKMGAADFLTKPLDLEHLQIALAKTIESRRQRRELRILRQQVVRQASFEGLVGVSRPMQEVYERIRRVAPSGTNVLLQGETGTGKDQVARALHVRSGRQGRFVAVNCGALSENLLENELFGHEKGAFTGAVDRRPGLLEQADRGTLFLDEVEEMSPALQVKLLRAVEDRRVQRLGGDQEIAIDFRLVAACNADLQSRAESGAFRADLYYRLSGVIIRLPPLRQRVEDIPLLARHFAFRYAEREGKATPEIEPEALMLLQNYIWPGNVRELERAVEQAVVLSDGSVAVKHLPETLAGAGREAGAEVWELELREARSRFERQYLEEVLRRAGGNVSEAARRAGIHRRHFHEKMSRYGISRADL